MVDENIQARLRLLILAAHVNRHGGLLLNTSNRTELALGYGTLWADLAGTLSVLGDVGKPDVYALSELYADVIPSFVRERAPSAELAADQVDPFDYDAVAPVVDALLRGQPVDADDDLRRRVQRAEQKRWQSGVVLKVSERAIGTGRMMPITHGWRGR